MSKKNERMNDDGSYVVKKSKKSSIFAFIMCIIIAFVIWLYAVNMKAIEDKKAAEQKPSEPTTEQTANGEA